MVRFYYLTPRAPASSTAQLQLNSNQGHRKLNCQLNTLLYVYPLHGHAETRFSPSFRHFGRPQPPLCHRFVLPVPKPDVLSGMNKSVFVVLHPVKAYPSLHLDSSHSWLLMVGQRTAPKPPESMWECRTARDARFFRPPERGWTPYGPPSEVPPTKFPTHLTS